MTPLVELADGRKIEIEGHVDVVSDEWRRSGGKLVDVVRHVRCYSDKTRGQLKALADSGTRIKRISTDEMGKALVHKVDMGISPIGEEPMLIAVEENTKTTNAV